MHTKKYQCETCHFKTNLKNNLHNHILKHHDLEEYEPENIFECDGADTVSESSIDENSQSEHDQNYHISSEFHSEDEVDGDPEPVVLVPAPNQLPAEQPLVLEVDPTGTAALPSSLPLGIVTNARS